ncbi:hypothetical protein GWI33_002413 [Rhynchophorus ferrugineus]|uniref:Uncharacterized protein n=1 Tax=Rhynchophorus ferrugineus TaxID=354439 RepID=A0A834IXH7_RHYFE|nr:hypothetical protein GWI33_002413 [Rhynchophorus ferrugineus]
MVDFVNSHQVINYCKDLIGAGVTNIIYCGLLTDENANEIANGLIVVDVIGLVGIRDPRRPEATKHTENAVKRESAVRIKENIQNFEEINSSQRISRPLF